MRKRFSLLMPAVLVCMLASLMAFNATGADKDKENGEKASPEEKQADGTAKAAEDLTLAYDLISYGRATKTPESLVTAAIIIHRNPTKKFEDNGEGGEEVKAEDFNALLQEAAGMRVKDKTLAEYIGKVTDDLKEAPRGSTFFPLISTFNLGRNQTRTFSHSFRKTLRATVRVSSLPHVHIFPPSVHFHRLDVNIRDGTKIYYDTVPQRVQTAHFNPIRTGPVRISIKNVGSDTTRVVVISN